MGSISWYLSRYRKKKVHGGTQTDTVTEPPCSHMYKVEQRAQPKINNLKVPKREKGVQRMVPMSNNTNQEGKRDHKPTIHTHKYQKIGKYFIHNQCIKTT